MVRCLRRTRMTRVAGSCAHPEHPKFLEWEFGAVYTDGPDQPYELCKRLRAEQQIDHATRVARVNQNNRDSRALASTASGPKSQKEQKPAVDAHERDVRHRTPGSSARRLSRGWRRSRSRSVGLDWRHLPRVRVFRRGIVAPHRRLAREAVVLPLNYARRCDATID
jgi:hypothetical protein